MEVLRTELSGLLLIKPQVFGDKRGYFMETFRAPLYRAHGIAVDFVQDNFSSSGKGVLRGLHFQNPHTQGKLVQVLKGEVYDVAVDLRLDSPTFGRWLGFHLNAATPEQIYIPPGFAHGFCTLSEEVHFLYKCTDTYHPETEATLLWCDPELGIDWPCQDPAVSAKDDHGMTLSEYRFYQHRFF